MYVGVLLPSPAESGGPRRGPLLPLPFVAFLPLPARNRPADLILLQCNLDHEFKCP